MEIMALPNKETLTFYDQVRPWIAGNKQKNGTVYVIFSNDTPNHILQLFDKIKNKLPYKVDRF